MPSRRMRAGRVWQGSGWRGSLMVSPRVHPRGFRLIQRGQASLEILIVLIFLIPLIFGAIELSRGVAVKSSLDSGVGLAVRALSVDPTNWTWAADLVSTTVAQNVFGSAGLGTVNFEAYDSSGTRRYQADFATLNFGAGFYIEAWVLYTPEIPLLSLTTASITIRARHYGIIERIN
jgi:Flp pilus assembly protein TadG